MTRKERRENLSEMWGDMPLTSRGITDEVKFFRWQGRVAPLLSFNLLLQADFRDAVNSISKQGNSSFSYKPIRDRIYTIMAQAIEQLGLPEQPAAPVLTADHGVLWFINHCTWSTRLKLAGIILTSAGFVFFVGFRLGAIDRVRSAYIQWENSLSSRLTASPTPVESTK
jgi:hypothetical protein